jgi:hypothetical protein
VTIGGAICRFTSSFFDNTSMQGYRMTTTQITPLTISRRAGASQHAAASIAMVSDRKSGRAFALGCYDAGQPQVNRTIRAAGSDVGGRTP